MRRSKTKSQQGGHIHQPTAWPVPHACAQPYHPGSGSHGQQFRPYWGSSAWHSRRVNERGKFPPMKDSKGCMYAPCCKFVLWGVAINFEIFIRKVKSLLKQTIFLQICSAPLVLR